MKRNMITGLLAAALLTQGAAVALAAHDSDAAHRAALYDRQTEAHMARVQAGTAHPVIPEELKTYRHVIKDLKGGHAKAHTWIAASDVKSYYLALNQIVAAYPQAAVDQYRLTVREVPTSYYVRDVLIPARKDAGLSVDGYRDYAYSMTTYQVEVVRPEGVRHQVLQPKRAHARAQYRVAKISQKDYTADHQLLGEQTWNQELTVAEPGSDAYTLAAGVDRHLYRFRPAGR